MLPVRANDHLPLRGHVVHLEALVAHESGGGRVDLDAGEHLLVADAAARVGIGDLDEAR